MKKQLVSTVILCVITLSPFGQAEPRVGLKIGYNHTRGNAPDINSVTYLSGGGVSIGIYRDFKLGEEVGLESGLMIDTYSTNYRFGSFNQLEAKDKFSYLTIPLIFQVQSGSKVNINTGPQLGFLLSAKAESDGREEDVKKFTKGTLFNWAIGLEVNTGAGIELGLRYLLGITDINDAKDIIDASYKLNTVQIYTGIRF